MHFCELALDVCRREHLEFQADAGLVPPAWFSVAGRVHGLAWLAGEWRKCGRGRRAPTELVARREVLAMISLMGCASMGEIAGTTIDPFPRRRSVRGMKRGIGAESHHQQALPEGRFVSTSRKEAATEETNAPTSIRGPMGRTHGSPHRNVD